MNFLPASVMSQLIFYKNLLVWFHIILKIILSHDCNFKIYCRDEKTDLILESKTVHVSDKSRIWQRLPSKNQFWPQCYNTYQKLGGMPAFHLLLPYLWPCRHKGPHHYWLYSWQWVLYCFLSIGTFHFLQ